MFYKNTSNCTKTFHGVTFHPGEVKEVFGYINHPKFISVSSMPKEPPKSVESAKRPGRPKKTVEPQVENELEQEEVLDGTAQGDKET